MLKFADNFLQKKKRFCHRHSLQFVFYVPVERQPELTLFWQQFSCFLLVHVYKIQVKCINIQDRSNHR